MKNYFIGVLVVIIVVLSSLLYSMGTYMLHKPVVLGSIRFRVRARYHERLL